jgi:phage baseplate assembly protein V
MSSRDDAFEVAELARRFDQVIVHGRIVAVDLTASRAKVIVDEDDEAGGATSDWLAWLEARHGKVRSRFAPAIDEHVVVLAPTGEINAGVILGGLSHSGSVPPWTSDKGIDFGGGASWSHDVTSNTTRLALPASGTIELTIGTTTKLTLSDGAITIEAASVKLGPVGLAKELARKGDAVAGGVIVSGSASVKAS